MVRIMIPTTGGGQFWADRRYCDGWRVQENVVTGHHRLLDAANRRHVFGTLEQCLARLGEVQLDVAPPEVVVLLHGLGRSRRSLLKLGRTLEVAGHHTIPLDYPSTRRSLNGHVEQVVQVLEHLEGAQRVNFVTHSLGGIVTRGVLSSPAWPERLAQGRVVMMAPPNQGASLARILQNRVPKLFGAAVGPSGFEIANGPPYPEPSVPVMVIAGRPRDGGLNPLLEGDDDGVVCVEETKLQSMEEHLVVDAIHTVVMDHPEATSAAVRFLEPVLRLS